jgi:phosphocarrier protein
MISGRAIGDGTRRAEPAAQARMSDQEITGVSRTYTIENRQGLHLRPASQLVQIFTRCPDCEVFVSVAETRVNGKSIMGLLMLEAGPDTELTVEAAGAGAEEILDRVGELIAARFGED